MPIKTVEIEGKNYAEVTDGKIVMIETDGTETPYDTAAFDKTVARVLSEAKGHRTAKEAAEKSLSDAKALHADAEKQLNEITDKLKKFDGITDVKAALKAVETIKNIDDKKLVDAGEMEALRKTITAESDAKLEAANKVYEDALAEAAKVSQAVTLEKDTLQTLLYDQMIGGAFFTSKFIADKCHPDAAQMQKLYGSHFKIEEGKPVARDGSGNVIFSTTKGGEPALPDEALEILVNADPGKDRVLKAVMDNGSGSKGNEGKGSPGEGDKIISRPDFDKMTHFDRASKMKDGYKIVDPTV